MKSKQSFALVCIGLLAVAAALLAVNQDWFTSDPDKPLVQQRDDAEQQADEATREASRTSNRQDLAKALNLDEDEIVNVGGVERPKRDLNFANGAAKNESSGEAPSVASQLPPAPRAGAAPRLMGNENSQVSGLVAELQGNQEGDLDGPVKEAMSSYFKPEPFDREAYAANPEAWLNRIRPARAYAPADPAQEVTPLESQSPGFHRILQGEQVVLRVKADSGQPVTFYTPQVGSFDNLLSTYSVAANEEGIATATYKTGPGSLGLTDVVVASPVHSGQIQYRINVSLPESVAAATDK